MEANEINLGENIIRRIKNIYFDEIAWPECHQEVAKKFTLFKAILRKFHGFEKSQNEELLKMCIKYTDDDVREVFSMENEFKKIPDKSINAKYDERVVWVPVPVDKTEILNEIKKMLD